MCWGKGREEERAAVQSTNLRTKAEPQQIVAQRLLSCLQYPVPAKSFTEDLTQPTFQVVFLKSAAVKGNPIMA
jgi:hypothetical protein